MQQFILSTPPLAREDAHFLANMLGEAVVPQAHAVSSNCVDEAKDLWAVEAYYDQLPTPSEISPLLVESPLTAKEISINHLEERNWVKESLKGLSPVRAARFYVHGTHDRHTRPKTTINIEIDAGTAFGTGHHETTTGCLLALADLAKPGTINNILDIGCGTGVLAIAAAKILKKPAIASDIDPEAVRVARKNTWSNLVGPLVTTITATGVSHQTIRQNAPYDLIFANILARPLIALAPKVAPLLARSGHIVLSGLNLHQQRAVLAAWRGQGLIVRKAYHINDWATLEMGH